jgi:predicted permease
MSMIRQAFRSLRRAPGFAVVALTIVAIAIAANTIVFSAVDAVLLRPLPYRYADRLFTLSKSNPKRGTRDGPFSHPAFVELVTRDRMFDGLAALTRESFNWSRPDRPEQLPGARVSAAFFDVLGLDVAVGRRFVSADDEAGSPAVIIIGRRLWLQQFGASPRSVGTALTLNGSPHTIIGVLASDLPPPFERVDVWSTRVDLISGFAPGLIHGGLGYLTAVGRLRSDVSRSEAQAEVDTISRGYAQANPTNTDADPEASLALTPLRDRSDAGFRAPLLVLMAVVGVVLLIACANLAGLFLVRGTVRANEAAIRLALGASGPDLLRWMLSEAVLLALAGGVAGVLLAAWGIAAVATLLQSLPRSAEIGIDSRVLLFSGSATMVTVLLFGLAPSAVLLRRSTVDVLRGVNRVAASSRLVGGRSLVAVEIALSLVLLVAAALLLESFVGLTRVRVGFNAADLVTMRVSLPTPKYADATTMRAFADRAIGDLSVAPGISAAALAASVPPEVTTMAPYIQGDIPVVGIGERPVGQWTAITPSYFSTMGIPLLAGRPLTAGDNDGAPLVVVVNQTLADRAWPGQSAIGKKLLVGRFPGFADVVGVVGDVKNAGLAAASLPEMYTPFAQRPWPAFSLVVRSRQGLAVVNQVRAALAKIDPDLPITRVQTVESAFSDSIATTRQIATLIAVFAGVAIAMAAAGLYGVIAYAVERRRREIGVRVALGAAPRAVVTMVVREMLPVTILGIMAGTLGAAAGGGLIRNQLFEVSSVDPATYALVVFGFAVIAALACIGPIRRALGVDPVVALRSE